VGTGCRNTVELATEVGRNKPAQAGVSGKLTGQMPQNGRFTTYDKSLIQQY